MRVAKITPQETKQDQERMPWPEEYFGERSITFRPQLNYAQVLEEYAKYNVVGMANRRIGPKPQR